MSAWTILLGALQWVINSRRAGRIQAELDLVTALHQTNISETPSLL
jgi:hypothetical protein